MRWKKLSRSKKVWNVRVAMGGGRLRALNNKNVIHVVVQDPITTVITIIL
jgi:hypothetical protein